MLQPRLFNPSGMAVSIATHLAVLTVGFGYASVRPFEATPVEAIAVDLVAPDEVKQASQQAPPAPQPSMEISDSSGSDSPAPSKSEMPQPPQQATPPAAEAAQPAAKPAAVQTAAAAPQPLPSWRPPEPDLTVKYQVNLGLPARPGDDFDAPASAAAKVSDDHIARFRERLKTCSVLPDSVAPTDKVTIRLRANFRPDGRLASAPLLIEASASAKGPVLMQAAIHALEGCQPYAALPADKYGEWKVLDLNFTPQDFRRG
ncbi:MAG TPA: hypothetical protein VFQ87_02550 [Bradyrhizobium sp.]|jgi:hypothetical protein|nr:hypothetical protein [Bradyrhizobium sp.]